MIKRKPLTQLFVAAVLLLGLFSTSVSADDFQLKGLPEPLELQLSADELTITNGIPLKAVINDPNPSTLRRIPLPPEYSLDPDAATATFNISYIPAGSTDKWAEPCSTFPAQAKTVFTAAANVWASILNSSVPITIKACWATNMGSSSILGYSGGGSLHRDFTGATRSGTFYSASLANSLRGTDLATTNEDMHITYNSQFNWYYGTDGNPGSSQHDLFSVVLHEIAHGLNFSGSMYVSGSYGYWVNYPYPNIYDTFMRDSSGNALISAYSNGTTMLASALTSNGLYFHGANAMAANGNTRVKMYAPASWAGGSSYSHLDYTTFNNTAQQLMVYAISAGEAIHDPGTITRGLLKDLGWTQNNTKPVGEFPWPTFLPTILLSRPAAAPVWGADNEVCCTNGGWTSFNLSSGGITKHSVVQSCSASSASWEGWQSASAGTKTFTWNITSANCGSLHGSFNYALQAGKLYRFFSTWTGSTVEIWVTIYSKGSGKAPRGQTGTHNNPEEHSIIGRELLTVIPATTVNNFTKGQCNID